MRLGLWYGLLIWASWRELARQIAGGRDLLVPVIDGEFFGVSEVGAWEGA